MYTHIRTRLEEMKKESKWLHIGKWQIWHKGLPLPIAPGKVHHTITPTLFVINMVSLLDEAIEMYVDNNFPDYNPRHEFSFGKLLKELKNRNLLCDFDECDKIRLIRNKYAHEFGQYSTWDEFNDILAHVEKELKHLGIIN